MKNTIIVILVLAVLGLGGYKMYIWKTQPYTEYGDYVIKSEQDNSFTTKPAVTVDETANWKTYKPEGEWGFEVKYPSNWKVVSGPGCGAILATQTDNQNYSAYILFCFADQPENGDELFNTSNIVVDNHQATQKEFLKHSNSASGDYYAISVLGSNWPSNAQITLRIFNPSNNPQKAELINQFRMLLSTFRFTK